MKYNITINDRECKNSVEQIGELCNPNPVQMFHWVIRYTYPNIWSNLLCIRKTLWLSILLQWSMQFGYPYLIWLSFFEMQSDPHPVLNRRIQIDRNLEAGSCSTLIYRSQPEMIGQIYCFHGHWSYDYTSRSISSAEKKNSPSPMIIKKIIWAISVISAIFVILAILVIWAMLVILWYLQVSVFSFFDFHFTFFLHYHVISQV